MIYLLMIVLQDLRKASALKSQVDTYKKQVRNRKVSVILLSEAKRELYSEGRAVS